MPTTMTMRRKEAIWFYVIISPWIFGFVVFTAGPILASIYLSFTEWDLFNAPEWVNFDNFTKLLTRDRVFKKAIYNTFYVQRHLISRKTLRQFRGEAMSTWDLATAAM